MEKKNKPKKVVKKTTKKPKKKKPGRKRKLTIPTMNRRAEKYFQELGDKVPSLKRLRLRCGYTDWNIADWKKAQPKLAAAIAVHEEEVITRVEEAMLNSSSRSNPNLMFYLKCSRPKEYNDKASYQEPTKTIVIKVGNTGKNQIGSLQEKQEEKDKGE